MSRSSYTWTMDPAVAIAIEAKARKARQEAYAQMFRSLRDLIKRGFATRAAARPDTHAPLDADVRAA
jgi:hypothetical protein